MILMLHGSPKVEKQLSRELNCSKVSTAKSEYEEVLVAEVC